MSDTEPVPDSLPDEVPVADAVEQALPAAPAGEQPSLDETPFDSDPADWQEQRQIVEDPDEDYR